jgi:hypothetical protein
LLRDLSGLLRDDMPDVVVAQLAKFVTALKIFGEQIDKAVAKKSSDARFTCIKIHAAARNDSRFAARCFRGRR